MKHETNQFVDLLIQEGWLKTPEIVEAFKKIKREDFIPEDMKDMAELNQPLPIGFGQTISQPLTVAFMLELLQPVAGDKILDVGAGSGWTSALLGFIACPPKPEGRRRVRQKEGGKVVAIELIPELAEFGKNNVEKYGFIGKGIVDYICADGTKGFQKSSPYDKILISAASSLKAGLSPALKEQLKIGGRLVCPVGNSIWLFIKKNAKQFEEKEYPGFVFVPLVQK
jgi:protein-L-isoaspartate(D-aspartate) O-methyltransferase